MKFLVDAMLPRKLVAVLREAGFDARHVRGLKSGGLSDADIWETARASQEIVITRDKDFLPLAEISFGQKLVITRSGNTSREQVCKEFRECLQQLSEFEFSDTAVLELFSPDLPID